MGVKKYLFAIFALPVGLAFIGAGSASATVLCFESTTSGCTNYGAPLIRASLGGSSTFSTTGGTLLDTCTSGVMEGAVNSVGGSSETIGETIGELIWESCTKTTDTIKRGELEVHWISGTDNGTVTGKNISVTINTVFGTCTYGTGSALDLGTLKGGNPATIEVNSLLSKQAGGFTCPSEAKWAASYSVTSPQPLYVGESVAAAAPLIEVKNTGGVGKTNSTTCEFTQFNQTCALTVTNGPGSVVVVTEVEIFEREVKHRYVFGEHECVVGKEIAKGGFCTDIVRLNVVPEAGWFDGYYIRVSEKVAPGNTTLVNAQLNTK